jgi:hypothetical protein
VLKSSDIIMLHRIVSQWFRSNDIAGPGYSAGNFATFQSHLPCPFYSPKFGLLKLPELPPELEPELFFFFAPYSASIVNRSVFPICAPTQTRKPSTTTSRRKVDSVNSIRASSVARARGLRLGLIRRQPGTSATCGLRKNNFRNMNEGQARSVLTGAV